jgi:broad specificity polyphosphatase/5'/3'-nucleotidase SurE
MLVDGKKIEVKTQVPFIIKDAFSILQKQLNKCLKADAVYFVSVPNTKKEHYSDGKVYRIESNKIKYQFHKTKDGRQMILIPIRQPDMKEVFQMSQKECEILQRYSVSKWN